MTKIFVEGQFEVVAVIKGTRIMGAQPVLIETSVGPTHLVSESRFFQELGERLKQSATALFIAQLRKDSDLKRRVGGTKWSVKLTNDVIEFPIFHRLEDVGHIEKFLNPNPYKLLEQIISRNQHIFAELQAEITTTV